MIINACHHSLIDINFNIFRTKDQKWLHMTNDNKFSFSQLNFRCSIFSSVACWLPDYNTICNNNICQKIMFRPSRATVTIKHAFIYWLKYAMYFSSMTFATINWASNLHSFSNFARGLTLVHFSWTSIFIFQSNTTLVHLYALETISDSCYHYIFHCFI